MSQKLFCSHNGFLDTSKLTARCDLRLNITCLLLLYGGAPQRKLLVLSVCLNWFRNYQELSCIHFLRLVLVSDTLNHKRFLRHVLKKSTTYNK